MKNLIYTSLFTLILSGLIIFVLAGCVGREPRKIHLKQPGTYLGSIQSADYLPGGSHTSPRTIVKTENGSFPVYGNKACINGKKVWLFKDGETDKPYIKVEDEVLLWEMTR